MYAIRSYYGMKVFDLGVATAGLSVEKAREAGYDPVAAVVAQADHAHFYPNSELIYMTLVADRRSRKVLGVQATGKNGNAIKARMDGVAVLLEHGVGVDDICGLETGYAPPRITSYNVCYTKLLRSSTLVFSSENMVKKSSTSTGRFLPDKILSRTLPTLFTTSIADENGGA